MKQLQDFMNHSARTDNSVHRLDIITELGKPALLIKSFKYYPQGRNLIETRTHIIDLNKLRDGFNYDKTLWLCKGESFAASHASCSKLSQRVLKDYLEYFIKDSTKLLVLNAKGLSFDLLKKIGEFSGLEDEFQVNKSVFNKMAIRTLAIDLSYLAFDQVKSFYCARAYMESPYLPQSIEIASSINKLNNLVFYTKISEKEIIQNYFHYIKSMCQLEEQCLKTMSENNYYTNYFDKPEAFVLNGGKKLLVQLEKLRQIFNSEPENVSDFYDSWCALNEKNQIYLNIPHLPEQLQNFYKANYESARDDNRIRTNKFIEGFMKWFNSDNKIQLQNNIAPAVNTEESQQDNVMDQEGTEESCQATSSSQLVTNEQTDNLNLGISSEELEVLQEICGY